jgi:hypothetical protein
MWNAMSPCHMAVLMMWKNIFFVSNNIPPCQEYMLKNIPVDMDWNILEIFLLVHTHPFMFSSLVHRITSLKKMA